MINNVYIQVYNYCYTVNEEKCTLLSDLGSISLNVLIQCKCIKIQGITPFLQFLVEMKFIKVKQTMRKQLFF